MDERYLASFQLKWPSDRFPILPWVQCLINHRSCFSFYAIQSGQSKWLPQVKHYMPSGSSQLIYVAWTSFILPMHLRIYNELFNIQIDKTFVLQFHCPTLRHRWISLFFPAKFSYSHSFICAYVVWHGLGIAESHNILWDQLLKKIFSDAKYHNEKEQGSVDHNYK